MPEHYETGDATDEQLLAEDVDLEPPTVLEALSKEKIEAIEKQIDAHRQEVKFDIREYPVETIVDKFTNGIEEGINELFIPDYQRELNWDRKRKSKFIESVFIGLPIPYLFACDVAPDDIEEDQGRFEIIDGSQRVRTLAEFVSDRFPLTHMEKLKELEGLRFSQLPLSRRRRFNRTTLRLIELEKGTTETTRRDLFERINTGSLELTDMDVRWGVMDGIFVRFVKDCSEDPVFRELTPFSPEAVKLREPQEFVLRFFAYLERRDRFERSVRTFLDEYLRDKESEVVALDPDLRDIRLQQMRQIFDCTMAYVRSNLPHGFAKGPNRKRTPRIRFEAIAVGVAAALQEKPELPATNAEWLESTEFKQFVRSDASNSRPKLLSRIDFVRRHLVNA